MYCGLLKGKVSEIRVTYIRLLNVLNYIYINIIS